MVDITALFSLSYGIYLLGAHDPDQPEKKAGCLVNTVFQLTADPIQVGVSVAKANQTHDYIMAGGTVSVMVMGEEAETKLLGTFGYRSGRDFDKYGQIDYQIDEHGDPLISESAVAHLSCTVNQVVDLDTHSLFVCNVTQAVKLSDGQPMTYNYFRNVKKGKSSRYAPTYIDPAKLAGQTKSE